MRKRLLWPAALLAVLLAAQQLTGWLSQRPRSFQPLDPALTEQVRIAEPAEALSLARDRHQGQLRVLLVRGYADERVQAIDVGAVLGEPVSDPLALYARLGYPALRAMAESQPADLQVPVAELLLPFEPLRANLGVGLAYADHAQEAGLSSEPVLFPKQLLPTPALSAISRQGAGLLDYEAELGFVVLQDGSPGQPPALGLVLANDVSDRWALIRGADRQAVMGTTGFAEGKGRAGYGPIGPLLVIPRDLDRFYGRIRLQLWLNGQLRQDETAAKMIWTPAQVLREIFGRARVRYQYSGQELPLLAEPERLPARTLIYSGTPAGVLFKPWNLWNPGIYLQTGDEVLIRADYLGVIRNRVID